MELNTFLNEYCEGKHSTFATKFGKLHTNVNRIFRAEYDKHLVLAKDGDFHLVKRVLKDGEFITKDNEVFKIQGSCNEES